MNELLKDKEATTPRPSDGQAPGSKIVLKIIIVSRNVFQNQLVKAFLESRLSGPCDISIQSEWHSVLEEEDSADHPANDDRPPAQSLQTLALLDCFDVAAPDLWRKLGLGGGPDPAALAIALFNVAPDSNNGFELEAIEHSVRGVFYLNEPPALLAKGIEKILSGELWFSRKATSQILMDPQRFRPRPRALEAMLTIREKEILVTIASGAGNTEIAEEFNISLNTVKTHLYNIYKKIDVRNRLEATLWVARYL